MKEFLLFLLLCLMFAIPALGQKHPSEREAEGLQGKVKSIVTEASLKSARGESAPILVSKVTFYADGTLNTRENYGSSGEVLSSSSYSFVEGERIVKMKAIYPPNMVVIGDPTKIKRPSDPRYTYKIRYKFDRLGRRIEAVWLRSDDSIYLKYVYSYNSNQREEIVDFDNGLKLEKKVSILDRKGNELEVFHRARSDNSLYYKEKYTYMEFDRHGNWIKRVESRMDENKSFDPIIISRTITYH